ncbi:glycosyltransferase family 4 protein [Haladaptatus sp. NG-SE-30]
MRYDPNILHLYRRSLHPPSDGGQNRTWETAKKLTEFGTVWLAHPCSTEYESPANLRTVPLENPFMESKLGRTYAWYSLLGLSEDNPVELLQTRLTTKFVERLGVEFDLICCESPQLLRASHQLTECFDARLLLNVHNATFDLLDQQLGGRPIPESIRERAVANLKRFEQRWISEADAVVFQSEQDCSKFEQPADTIVETIPNGTHYEQYSDEGDSERLRNKLGLREDATVCLFVGAYDYEPNADAAEKIVRELAPALPDIEFLLVGRNPPNNDRANVHTPGFVEHLPDALSLADVAICPLTLGSGTKLKMMDYLAAGLPIVTTHVGAQGIKLEDSESALIRDSRSGFVDGIQTLRDDPALRRSLGENAQELGRKYDWSVLMDGYEPIVETLLGER